MAGILGVTLLSIFRFVVCFLGGYAEYCVHYVILVELPAFDGFGLMNRRKTAQKVTAERMYCLNIFYISKC